MAYKQIGEYFKLIKRVSKDQAYFLTQNRVEKIPISSRSQTEAPVRFAEYPWISGNEVLVYQICSLYRLVSLNSIYVRLEKIIKWTL